MPHPRWLDTLVVRTVRAIETADGPLDDAEALRRAATSVRGRDERLIARAWALAQPLGLPDEIARWRAALPWLLLGAAVLVALLAHTLIGLVTGQDRHINAVAALLAVLALPTLSLLLWLASLAWRQPPLGGGLSRWTLALAARLPGLRTPHGLRLLRSGLDALAQARLLPWVLGWANHLVWIVAFIGMLLGLLSAFAFRAYTLTWETTILDPAFFAQLVAGTGWLPARLGFPVPDAAAVMAAPVLPGAAPAGDPRPWAWWLLGCTLVYGLAPRLLAAAACWAVWRARQPRLNALDPTDPYLRQLDARFDRWDAAVVTDAEHRPLPSPATSGVPATTAGTLAVVGFELPEPADWPPADLSTLAGRATWQTAIAGTADERRGVLDRIAQTRPQRVLLVCHGPSTPDRGTERFAREALAWGAQGGLLLRGDAPPQRWADWLQRSGLAPLRLFTDAAAASAWAEGHDHG